MLMIHLLPWRRELLADQPADQHRQPPPSVQRQTLPAQAWWSRPVHAALLSSGPGTEGPHGPVAVSTEPHVQRFLGYPFSTGFSSGLWGGSVRLSGTTRPAAACHPAPSRTATACAPGATWRAISAECRPVAAAS